MRRTPNCANCADYLISRLLWDPTLDDRKIIDEFVSCTMDGSRRQGAGLSHADR